MRFLHNVYSSWSEQERLARPSRQDGVFLNYRVAMSLAELSAQYGAPAFDRDPEDGSRKEGGCRDVSNRRRNIDIIDTYIHNYKCY